MKEKWQSQVIFCRLRTKDFALLVFVGSAFKGGPVCEAGVKDSVHFLEILKGKNGLLYGFLCKAENFYFEAGDIL